MKLLLASLLLFITTPAWANYECNPEYQRECCPQICPAECPQCPDLHCPKPHECRECKDPSHQCAAAAAAACASSASAACSSVCVQPREECTNPCPEPYGGLQVRRCILVHRSKKTGHLIGRCEIVD